MPHIKVDDGCIIHVEVEGPERAPVLMLSNSLGTDLHMWDEQVGPFTRHFRLVRYDRRGHGKSSVPKGPYTMERLGRDVVAVLDNLGIQKINWCGLSMGGMVGMWLGANAANRTTNSFSPIPPRIFLTGQSGTHASSSYATRAWMASLTPTWSAGSRQRFVSAPLRP
jgi:pimeloyl-ACP methyl ester carboxylesterase